MVVSAGLVPTTTHDASVLVDRKKFNCVSKLTPVMVLIMRFINKCRKGNVSTSYLSAPESPTAESRIIKIALAQQEAYPQEYEELSDDKASKRNQLMYQLGLYNEGDMI